MAPPMVNISPALTEKPFLTEIINNPTNERLAAIQILRCGTFLYKAIFSKGTITTQVPAKNADCEAEVSLIPRVCSPMPSISGMASKAPETMLL
ncbi:hypothetical protein D3C73_1218800 [compost metagenome]